MERTATETASPPEALKQLQLVGVNDEGEMVFRRGVTSKPSSNTDPRQKENGSGMEELQLSQADIDKRMMPPPALPSRSPPCPPSTVVHVAATDQPAGEPPEKRCRLSDELSEDSEDHADGCLFMMWVTHRKTLMTDEEVRSAFIENASMKKNSKKRKDMVLRKVPEALKQGGHVMEYLKSQREYYDSLKQQFIDRCDCFEECSDSND